MIVNKLFLNGNHAVNPNGSLTNARNVRFDDNQEFLTNEEGFEKLHTFPATICGVVPTDVETIVFCTDNAGDDYIYRVTETTATLALNDDLSLSTDHPITGEYQYNNIGQLIVVFNDANNELRLFNFDDPYMDLDVTNKYFLNPSDGINRMKLFPEFTTPVFKHDDKLPNHEGSLPKGVYYVTLSYYIGEHDRLNWTLPSLPFNAYKVDNKELFCLIKTKNAYSNVHFHDWYQTTEEDLTDSAINLSITGLDIKFSKYKLALIYRTDTITRAYDLGDYPITTSAAKHTITKLSNTELSLDEVTIPYINIGIPEDITLANGRLTTLGNKTNNQLDYQKYANNIKVSYDVEINAFHTPELPPDGFYLNEFNGINIRTPIWDEVYALNIGLIGNDGTVKGIYHIPGRPPETLGGSLLNLENRVLTSSEQAAYNTSDGRNLNETVELDYYYQLYNTADVYGVGDDKLAYWENRNEFYPDKEDFQIWDVDSLGNGFQIVDESNGLVPKYANTLVGQRVRHHKMPSLDKTTNAFAIDNHFTKRSLSLNFSNIKFPKEILNEISGYFICYSDRDSTNSTVMGTYPMIRNDFYREYSIYPEIGAGSNENINYLRFNDEFLMTYKPAIAKPYLRYLYSSDPHMVHDNPTGETEGGTDIHWTFDTTFTCKKLYSEVRKVVDYKYIPKDNSATLPNNKGREESLILELKTPYQDDSHDTIMATLKSDVDDVYTPFYNRRVSLASTFMAVNKESYTQACIGIKYLDGYISHHYSLHYRNDASIIIDDDGTISRETDILEVLMAVKHLSIGIVNTHIISRPDIFMRLGADGITQEDLAGTGVVVGPGGMYLNNGEVQIESNIINNPAEDFGFVYNKYHSYTANIIPYYTRDPMTMNVASHPYRVSRSAVQGKEDLTFNWRYFSALEYHEMPKHRGRGVSITGQGKLLFIHMEHSLYLAQAKDSLKLDDNSSAFIGSADIFEREPDELAATKRGTAGIQSRFSNCLGTFGYVFADTYDKSIYAYSSDQVETITDETVRALYKKYMPVYSASISNPLTNNDVIFGIDERNKRIIVTSLGDTKFTMSYNYDSKNRGFISFHDYIPAIMVSNRIGSYSVNRDDLTSLYKFNSDTVPFGTYYDTQKEAYIDVLVNENPRSDKVIYSVSMQSSIEDDTNYINKLFIYNRNKCSNIYNLTEFATLSDYDKIRYLNDFWNYDMIRDYSSDVISQNIVDDFGNINMLAINQLKNWYELNDISGRYFIVRMITNNSADMIFRDLEYNVMLNRR